MNITITPTAEMLIQQLIELGHGTPESIVEQALEYLYAQQSIDTSLGFPELSEADIIRENKQRWHSFQQCPNGIPQSELEVRLL